MKKSIILAIIFSLSFVICFVIGTSYAQRGNGHDVQTFKKMEKIEKKGYGWKRGHYKNNPKYAKHKVLGKCHWRTWFDKERHKHPRNGHYHNDTETMNLMYSYCGESGCFSIVIEGRSFE